MKSKGYAEKRGPFFLPEARPIFRCVRLVYEIRTPSHTASTCAACPSAPAATCARGHKARAARRGGPARRRKPALSQWVRHGRG